MSTLLLFDGRALNAFKTNMCEPKQQPSKIKTNNNVQQQKQHFRFSWSQRYNFLQTLVLFSREGFYTATSFFPSLRLILLFFRVCEEKKWSSRNWCLDYFKAPSRKSEYKRCCEKRKSLRNEAIKDKRIYQKERFK